MSIFFSSLLIHISCSVTAEKNCVTGCLIEDRTEEVILDNGYLSFCQAFQMPGGFYWDLCPGQSEVNIAGFDWEWGYKYKLLVNSKKYRFDDAPEDLGTIREMRSLVHIAEKLPVEPNLNFKTNLFWNAEIRYTYSDFLQGMQRIKSHNSDFYFGEKLFICREPATCENLSQTITRLQDGKNNDICEFTIDFSFQETPELPLLLNDFQISDCSSP
jgi:hypothetical protein